MTPEAFCGWLGGYCEGVGELKPEHIERIKAKAAEIVGFSIRPYVLPDVDITSPILTWPQTPL